MTNSEDRRKRVPKPVPGIVRDDSDDELGTEDHPWEWIYSSEATEPAIDNGSSRKRKRTLEDRIIGARMGDFQCSLGDTVLLKAEGSNEAWVGVICEFVDDDEGEKAANFMWFSTEKEIRNKDKKRTDFYAVSFLPTHCRIAKLNHSCVPD
jgi:origin recognition complex subunit 1